jgi:hypothetical protein
MKIVSSSGVDQILPQEVIYLNMFQRMHYAFKGTGICILIAIGCILLPLLHFILVPLFLLISIYVGITRFRCNMATDLSEVKCPTCNADLTVKIVYFDEKGFCFGCMKCRSELKIMHSNGKTSAQNL